MNRREFIGAAAAAALTAGCAPSKTGGKFVTADRLGVCSWSYRLPMDAVAAEMKKLGLVNINLALQPFLEGDERHGKAEDAAACKRAEERIASGEWKVSATMISFNHEDYTTLETIRKTGGIVPDDHWEADRALVARAAKLTGEWKVPYMLMHAGFLDEHDKAAFEKYLYRVKTLRDICQKENVELILETGQETADDLARFMPLVEGVGVNFDPANMILYNKGVPVDAVKKIAPWIRHMHIKDARYTKVPGTWGEEVPWGDGEVNAQLLLKTLEEVGFKGVFAIEREAGDDRVGDIALAARRVLAAG
ncbi:MAG: sugar phosphate isomerase/epimerase [Lentisphaerae bacterium]|nr:sugar phosphate isomerase/epimerase [Lentisphaerota bacterium]